MIVVTITIVHLIQAQETNRDGDFDRASKRSLYTLLCNIFALIGVGVSIVTIVTITLYLLVYFSRHAYL